MNQAITAAKEMIEDMYANHEHDADCKRIETVEVTYFATNDDDQSYDREIYVCSVTGEDIDLSEADPMQDRADANDSY